MKTYDVDKSGALDREETKTLLKDTLVHMGRAEQLSDVEFEQFFKALDTNESGTIEREEMIGLLKKLMGTGNDNSSS